MEAKSGSPRLFSLLLIALSLVCLVAFYRMVWVDTVARDALVFGETFGSEAQNGWELLEWTHDVESAARLTMWVIWFTVPVITLLASLLLVLGGTRGAMQQWTRALHWLGVGLSGALVIGLTAIVLLIENPEALQEGYWVAGFCAICLTEGFAIQLREYDDGAGAPTVPPGDAFLFVLSGTAQGARVPITVTPFTIGRQEQNILMLPDDLTVSRQHAVILYHQGSYFLRAVSPTQPFWVGKTTDSLRQELSWRLESHDYFTIGESLIEFSIEAPT